jgi:predicted tellurium resistance membrane protein TerC
MEAIVALVALSAMEIVLGIDNIVFLAIVTGKLPAGQRPIARRLGLVMALGMRIVLLCAIKWVMGLTEPLFCWTDLGFSQGLFERMEHGEEVNGVSWRDLILMAGGLFLIRKSVREIHEKIEHPGAAGPVRAESTFLGVVLQITVLDMIFSLDSVITAVGMADELWVMITAVVIAIGVMLSFANPLSDFVSRHATLVMLALSFLILIGVVLVAEGIGTPIDKRYIYFAMAFALVVEFLNIRVRRVSTARAGATTGLV